MCCVGLTLSETDEENICHAEREAFCDKNNNNIHGNGMETGSIIPSENVLRVFFFQIVHGNNFPQKRRN